MNERDRSDARRLAEPPDGEADEHLFREAMRDVRRLVRARNAPPRPKPTAAARFTRADQHAVLAESLAPVLDPALLETGEELVFRRPHVPDRVLRRLRRGEYAVDGEIDLHGMTAVEARRALRDFVAESVARNARCVRIVHGKGRRSGPRGPILKPTVNLWLRKCDRVLAFGSARPIDGGSGAVYALLAQSRSR